MSGDPTPSIVWWEIWVDDVEAAKSFCGALFGWTSEAMTDHDPDYWLVRGAPGVGGAITRAPDDPVARQDRSGVVLYVDVADLEAAVERAVGLGAELERPRTAIGSTGTWFAIVRDPQGIRLGLYTERPGA